MRKEKPIIKGDDAKRFKLRSEKNQLNRELEVLDFKKQKTLLRISKINEELKRLQNRT